MPVVEVLARDAVRLRAPLVLYTSTSPCARSSTNARMWSERSNGSGSGAEGRSPAIAVATLTGPATRS